MRNSILFLGLILSLVLISGRHAQAEQPYAMPFGHDTSTTSYTLHASECTVGLQTVACGLSNYFSLGTSPWLYHDYNTASLLGRLRLRTSDNSQDAVQLAYFKTFGTDQPRSDYHMDLTWLYYIHSIFLTPESTVHFNLQAMYFRDDRFPFSLRRPWVDRKPIQINATALLEMHVVGGWYVNGEWGVLGALQSNPEFLVAMTLEYRFHNWLFHGGFSQLGTILGYTTPLARVDYQQNRLTAVNGFNGELEPSLARYDYSIHPEFALQYYF